MKLILLMLAVFALAILSAVWVVKYKIDKGKSGWR
jgi:hypothetical protein